MKPQPLHIRLGALTAVIVLLFSPFLSAEQPVEPMSCDTAPSHACCCCCSCPEPAESEAPLPACPCGVEQTAPFEDVPLEAQLPESRELTIDLEIESLPPDAPSVPQAHVVRISPYLVFDTGPPLFLKNSAFLI